MVTSDIPSVVVVSGSFVVVISAAGNGKE